MNSDSMVMEAENVEDMALLLQASALAKFTSPAITSLPVGPHG